MRRNSGFTLIELLVTIVIIAVLARIAIPMYTKYVQRGDLVEGTQALGQYRVQMEQYYQDNHTYTSTVSGGTVCGTNLPALVNFTMTCATANTGQTYVATATANNATPIFGAVYTITQANVQATTGMPTGFSATTSATSWITR